MPHSSHFFWRRHRVSWRSLAAAFAQFYGVAALLPMPGRSQHGVVQKIGGTGGRRLFFRRTPCGRFFALGTDAGTGRIRGATGKAGSVPAPCAIGFPPESGGANRAGPANRNRSEERRVGKERRSRWAP